MVAEKLVLVKALTKAHAGGNLDSFLFIPKKLKAAWCVVSLNLCECLVFAARTSNTTQLPNNFLLMWCH